MENIATNNKISIWRVQFGACTHRLDNPNISDVSFKQQLVLSFHQWGSPENPSSSGSGSSSDDDDDNGNTIMVSFDLPLLESSLSFFQGHGWNVRGYWSSVAVSVWSWWVGVRVSMQPSKQSSMQFRINDCVCVRVCVYVCVCVCVCVQCFVVLRHPL